MESKTNEEEVEVQTETLSIKATPMSNGYVKAKTGYDSNAVFRHTDNKKWFALVMDVQGNKLGLSGSEYIDVVNLKMDDLFFRDIIIKEDGIMPAYHMNKMHWVTVLLNGMVPEKRVLELIDMSFLATASAKKKEKERMKIEHIAMYVNNLEEARDFFVTYFGGKANDGYHNLKTNFRSYFITFEDGARLELMNKPGMDDPEKHLNRTGYAHIAFSVGSKEKVDALTERLQTEGYKVVSGPRTTGDGYYESCIIAIEENQIEITE